MSFKPIPNLNGTQADFAGSITMTGDTVATQSWVSSQNYLTSETDDQTLQEILDATPSATGTINVDAFSGVSGVLDVIQATGDLTLRPLGSDGNGGKLILDGDSFTSALQIENNGHIDWGAATYRFGLGSTYWQWKSWSKPIEIQGGAGTVMYIGTPAGDGNVGIGTTSPSQKLDVQGTILVNNEIQLVDSNMKIFRSSNDLRLRTSGIDRVTINSTGKVGIGTTSPTKTFEVVPSNGGFAFLGGGDVNAQSITDNTRKFARIGTPHYNNSEEPMLLMIGDSVGNSNIVNIGGGSALGNAATAIKFYTAANNTTTNGTERMQINSSGNVGIGTTSPSAKLDVNSSSGFGISVERGIEDGSRDGYSHSFTAGNAHILGRSVILESPLWFSNPSPDATTSTYNITTNSSNKLVINRVVGGATQDSNIFVVDGSNVGIGTTSPSEKLEVGGNLKISSIGTGNSASSYDLLFYGTTSSGTQTDQGAIHTSPWATNTNGGNLIFETSNTSNALAERMRIDGAGNVGIGTTSPTQTLHVEGSIFIKNNSFIRSKDGGATVYDLLGVTSSGIVQVGQLNRGLKFRGGGASSDIDFELAGSTQFILKGNTGNVGIGTSSPSAKLEVNGHFAATTKSFIIDNPEKGGRLQYGVVETDEHSVYVRGKSDQEVVELPEEWDWLVHEDSVTVQLTSVGQMQQLFVMEQNNKRIKVSGLAPNGQYNYVVYGTRKDVDALEKHLK